LNALAVVRAYLGSLDKPHNDVEVAFECSATSAHTTPSADFCHAVKASYDALSHVSVTQGRSPAIRLTAFNAQPPNLPPALLMVVDFAINVKRTYTSKLSIMHGVPKEAPILWTRASHLAIANSDKAP
jgi:hypothetical protein